MTFDQLAERWTWKPIPNCPGRFVLSDGMGGIVPRGQVSSLSPLSPSDLAGADTVFRTFEVATARDAVVAGRLDRGGLISYKRGDGTYVHTLNTPDGFDRKLQQLGIVLETRSCLEPEA